MTKYAQLVRSERLLEVNQMLCTEEATRTNGHVRKLNRERAELEPWWSCFTLSGLSVRYRHRAGNGGDPEMREFAEPRSSRPSAYAATRQRIAVQLLPKDPRRAQRVLEVTRRNRGDEAVVAGDCSACIRACRTQAGRSRSFPKAPAKWAATRKSLRASPDRRVFGAEI